MNVLSKKTKADESYSFDEYNAVVEALMPYIKGAKAGDGEVATSTLYDHTHVVGSMDGEFYNMDIASFKETITGLGEAPDVEFRIVWIDISGPAAAVKVELKNWLGFRFTDFFVLYKHEGQWKISAKVFDSHTRN
jgi:hypothetical protein